MKKILILSILLVSAFVYADELHVSTANPVFVVAPDQWKVAKYNPPDNPSPLEAYQISPPSGRNAAILFSIFDKSKPEFADPEFLKKVLRGTFLVYVSSPADADKVEIKALNIKSGLGFYANFIDPDLVGKPVEIGNYKTSTSAVVSLGSKYMVVITVLCDQINGADYRDAINIIETIKIKQPDPDKS